ncbi:Uncharacterized protein dnl_12490 [Desulfonema limicola]|uniref:Uncharacterized protein n=1 Tax=Desulfonema limicola TaxID=45656 RepID=A0A975GF88_9BACT|nr:hypothetical protein [Desulfonema limicola]QTA79002.1 Uncharacterized protein dnl_12490 [Desulfonema limicola]
MTFEDVKTAVMNLSKEDQKKLIIEVVPEIWGEACTDEECLIKMRQLVDKDTIKEYRKQHMNGI